MRISLVVFLLGMAVSRRESSGEATSPDQISVPPGFTVELLRAAGEREGSWISMTVDERGRLYISPQGAIPESGFNKESKWGGLWRATLNERGQIAAWDKVPVPIGDSMGMLWEWDRLYVSGNGPQGRGIYTVTDSDGDDTLDTWKLFKAVPGGDGEHGAHALVKGPDDKLYIVNGNSTPLIDGIAPDSPYKHYAEDTLLPRINDPVATFFDRIKSPYGYVLRTDKEGTKWELYAGGFRNPYDIDFNADGELFTFDSDMEWDVGLPWFRPTRILHVIAGGEYGFREGDSKWPDWREDSLPPVVNVGLGSPTGIKFGTKSNFPEKYKRALFAMDWTYGRILAVHMRPKGATYAAKCDVYSPISLASLGSGAAKKVDATRPSSSEDVEEFVKAKGLPVSDLEFGKDGAMYFIVGGRGTQAGLYRVSSNTESATSVIADPITDDLRILRDTQKLPPIPGLQAATKEGSTLGDPDRILRNANRLWLERGMPGRLPGRLTAHAVIDDNEEMAPAASLNALLGLARLGQSADQKDLLFGLTKFPLNSLNATQQLLKLRVINVSFSRQGRAAPELAAMGTEKLLKQYPAKGEMAWPLNYELSQLLVWLTNPEIGKVDGAGAARGDTSPALAAEVIKRTLDLLAAAPTQEEQIWYARVLADAAADGWTKEQRETYWKWWYQAASYQGGNSFGKFMEAVRERALAKCTPEERKAAEAIFLRPPKPRHVPPPRDFVKAWTMQDLAPSLAEVGGKRDLARGKKLYADAQCALCHKFKGEGGDNGPDLTAASSRYNRRDLLEAIIDPNKGVSEQYAVYEVRQFDDKNEATGMIVGENNTEMQVLTDPLQGTIARINLYKPAEKKLLPGLSFMPPGLLNTLSKEEVLDLLAYVESGTAR